MQCTHCLLSTAYYSTEMAALLAWNTRPGEDAALDRAVGAVERRRETFIDEALHERGLMNEAIAAIKDLKGEASK
ncbi:MAG TPA: hypothetical protein ENI07_16085 [Desulfobacterales bacterium]|nr:hypothetical protein [Desulfobacterales bacterium]